MARAQEINSTEKASADLAAQIATLKADVAELSTALADYGRAQKSQLSASAEDSLEAAKKLGVEKGEQARQHARDAYAGAEKAVRANPATSVGIAAGLGFLAGLLASRR